MAPAPDPIRVALVEDEESTRERIARVIRADPSLHLVYQAGTAADILSWLSAQPREQAPNVLLVDLGLPDLPGLEVIRRCRSLHPSCDVMVITMFGDEANVLKSIENGARGYLLKDGTEADLATHVLNLRAGGSPMSPLIARQLLERWAHQSPATGSGAKTPNNPMSKREHEVLDLLARGFTYAETARHLGISLATVHTHVSSIYGKLDVHNKAEAVYEARHQGWLP